MESKYNAIRLWLSIKKIVISLLATGVTVFGTIGKQDSTQAVIFSSNPTINPTAGSSSRLRASVDFQIINDQLVVTLTNTSRSDVIRSSEVLTAVFFNLANNPTLTPLSASLSDGSSIIFPPAIATDPQPSGVGGEWAYKNGLTTTFGATQGISSVGLGLFRPNNRFPGANLQGTDSLNGVSYGITSARDSTRTGNSNAALIKNSVTFVLDNLPEGFTEAQINNVFFQYGNSFNEPRIAGEIGVQQLEVDEPSTSNALLVVVTGMLGLSCLAKKYFVQTNNFSNS